MAMTYEQKHDAVMAFYDKYESLIKEAPENSDLWVFWELYNAYNHVLTMGVWVQNRNWSEAQKCIINAMLHIAERWSNENDDIELVCTDPATGEETVIEGTPSEEEVL